MIALLKEPGKLSREIDITPNVSYGDDFLAGNVVALGISPDADVDFRSLTVDELDLLKIYFAICSVDRAQLLTDKE